MSTATDIITRIECTDCGAGIKLKNKPSGFDFKCPKCGTGLITPMPPPAIVRDREPDPVKTLLLSVVSFLPVFPMLVANGIVIAMAPRHDFVAFLFGISTIGAGWGMFFLWMFLMLMSVLRFTRHCPYPLYRRYCLSGIKIMAAVYLVPLILIGGISIVAGLKSLF